MNRRSPALYLVASGVAAVLILAAIFIMRELPAPESRTDPPKEPERPRTAETRRPAREMTPKQTATGESIEPQTARRIQKTKYTVPNERVVRFQSAAELNDYLEEAKRKGAKVLGVIPELNAARLGFASEDEADRLMDDLPAAATLEANYLVTLPTPPTGLTAASGYTGFGRDALRWLGVPQDNGQWGAGVKIAVLDTSIAPSRNFNSLQQMNLVENSAGIAPAAADHGTFVASILAGSTADARGVVPAANLLGIQVVDNGGTGNSFTVARGITAAVENGARVISMSLGSAGDSGVVRSAVETALQRNVAVVAAVGNEKGAVSFPASYPGVIAVTAVDANGQRADFANAGPAVTVAAPGIGVEVPGADGTPQLFSGTSAAAPFVSGALAYMFSQNPNLTVAEATEQLTKYSNDYGPPGTDPYYGAGTLNLKRWLQRNTSGINDVAIGDIYAYPNLAGSSGIPVSVSVQNRGTTSLAAASLDITTGQNQQRYYLPTMNPGEVKSQVIYVQPDQLNTPEGISIQSRVMLNGINEMDSENNARQATFRRRQ